MVPAMQNNLESSSDKSSGSSVEQDQPRVAYIQKTMKRQSHFAKVRDSLEANKGRVKMSMSPPVTRDKDGILFQTDDNQTPLLMKR